MKRIMYRNPKWYEFSKHPDSDSCWSLSTGPDGRIYAAACAETVPGGVVKVVRYDREEDCLEYLFDIDEVVEDPRDSGRGTQCKIHYSFAPAVDDDIMYMATHLSGPPIDLPAYSPWRFWHDEERCFRGSALVAYDTSEESVLWWDTMIPKEGCRCLAIDEELGHLYSLGYPRDHFYIYDIESREREDKGRIGSINAQVLFTDDRHRVWTSDDYGHLVRYDPQEDRIRRSPYILPHNPEYQTGWHSVLYDAARQPGTGFVWAVTWIAQPRLMRIDTTEGEWGSVEDLGPVTQERDLTLPIDTFKDHCGGLTFAPDGNLYFVASRWRDEKRGISTKTGKDMEGVVYRLEPDSLEMEEIAVLDRPGHCAQYVSRGGVDPVGDLFFGHVGPKPTGIFRLPACSKSVEDIPIRTWG